MGVVALVLDGAAMEHLREHNIRWGRDALDPASELDFSSASLVRAALNRIF